MYPLLAAMTLVHLLVTLAQALLIIDLSRLATSWMILFLSSCMVCGLGVKTVCFRKPKQKKVKWVKVRASSRAVMALNNVHGKHSRPKLSIQISQNLPGPGS